MNDKVQSDAEMMELLRSCLNGELRGEAQRLCAAIEESPPPLQVLVRDYVQQHWDDAIDGLPLLRFEAVSLSPDGCQTDSSLSCIWDWVPAHFGSLDALEHTYGSYSLLNEHGVLDDVAPSTVARLESLSKAMVKRLHNEPELSLSCHRNRSPLFSKIGLLWAFRAEQRELSRRSAPGEAVATVAFCRAIDSLFFSVVSRWPSPPLEGASEGDTYERVEPCSVGQRLLRAMPPSQSVLPGEGDEISRAIAGLVQRDGEKYGFLVSYWRNRLTWDDPDAKNFANVFFFDPVGPRFWQLEAYDFH